MEQISMMTTRCDDSLNKEEVEKKNTIELTETQISLLNSLSPGDVVWAKMPICVDEEYTSIRTYLVVLVGPLNIYAYLLSDIRSKRLNNYETYGIINGKYSNNKNLWLNLANVVKIPVNNVVSKMMRLKNDDLEMIEKRLQIQINRKKPVEQTFELPYRVHEGDVVLFNVHKYYVYGTDDKKLYCYDVTNKLQSNKTNLKSVRINRKVLYMDFSKQIIINSDDANIIDIASVDEILYIDSIKNAVKEKANKKTNKSNSNKDCKVGNVFESKNRKLMYLYENNDKFYFVDLLRYKAFPRLIEFEKFPKSKKLIEESSSETVEQVIRYLVNNMSSNVPKVLKRMYSEMF